MGFFLIIFGGLITPALQVLFQNCLVMSFAQAEAVPHRGLQTPLAVHGLWPAGMAADTSRPPSLMAASRAGTKVCPQALQVPAEESREAMLPVSVRRDRPPLPSLPPPWAAAMQHFTPWVARRGHAAPRLCGYRRQRWEKRGRASCFCPAQPL